MKTVTNLMPHQIPAVEKMMGTRIGALFMDMGLGKTRTAIEVAIRRAGKIDRVVWLCPVSLKETIRREILKHTDCIDSDVYVFGDKTNSRNITKAFWYVIGIESMSSSRRVILAANSVVIKRAMVIVDESTYIKGHHSARTSWITRIGDKANYRMILTGTPLSQGVVDLFAQMRFLSPKILGYASFYSFAANHLEYSEKFPGMIVRAHNTEWLAAKIKPYVYQVTKEECLNLPKKIFTSRNFRLTNEQLHAYQEAKDSMFDLLESESEVSRMAIFRLFSSLQQIASGFWHKRTGKDFVNLEFYHMRLDILTSAIEQIQDNKKIIIWAKFTHDIKAIVDRLQADFGYDSTAVFYGQISEKNRSEEVNKFRGKARFFVATQSCGGHGLTLNEAHYVIFYNNGFKYSERLQAEDRCHRIGQTESVTYINISASCGIEDRINDALRKKGNALEEFRAEVDKVKGCKNKIKKLVEIL